MDHSGSRGLMHARLGGRGVEGRACSLGYAWVHSYELPGSLCFAFVHSGTPWDRRVHSRSCGFTPGHQWVAEFIRVRVS